MLVKSFVVYAKAGRREALSARLEEIPGCRVVPSTNEDAMVLAVASASWEAEKSTLSVIESLPDLNCLLLAFGHNDDEGDQAHATKPSGPPH